MWFFNQQSASTRHSLAFITAGSLVTIWTIVWYAYLANNPPENHGLYYVCAGCLTTGIVVFLIGVSVGWIGRAASQAEQPAAAVEPNPPAAIPLPTAPTVNPVVNGAPVATGVPSVPAAAPPLAIHR
jgi:hypothetical protein